MKGCQSKHFYGGPFHLALLMPLGFFNLQALNIGLTVGDVGVVSLIVAGGSVIVNPMIGKSW